MPFDRMVCATDFSTVTAAALRRAVMLAGEHKATLEVLHVVSRESLDALRQWVKEPLEFPEQLVRAVREELEGCAADASRQAGVRIETRVVVGEVTDSILEHASASDLLVIGAHGTNPLKDLMLGTTAERLAGRATPPILVVRRPPERAYARLLVAVDLLPGSEELFAGAHRFGGNATLTALHVYDVPLAGMLARAGVSASLIDEHRARAYQEALDGIAALARRACGDGGRFLALAEDGHPAAAIVGRSHAMGADLVVIRKRSRSLAEGIVLGSVTRHVLADAAADVLLLAEPRR